MISTIIWIAIILFFIIYVVIPIIIIKYPYIITKIVFMDFINFPLPNNLCKAEKFGFDFTNFRNQRILTENRKDHLGVWKILSKDLECQEAVKDEKFDELFSSKPMIIYFHGNSLNRGGSHRVEIYKLFRNSGFNVLSFDYRGFGDSDGMLTNEEDICDDALLMLRHVVKCAARDDIPIYLWGHSLGTGVVSLLLKRINNTHEIDRISGVFLEAPFSCIKDNCDFISYGKLWSFLPYFDLMCKKPLPKLKMSFDSVENWKNIHIPVLILHAKDDNIISYDSGYKLFRSIKMHNKSAFFKSYEKHLKYGHRHIKSDPDFKDLLMSFCKACNAWKFDKQPISDLDIPGIHE